VDTQQAGNPGSPQALFDLSGKVALVTGGTRGLGLVMAHGFAQAGADVIVASRKAEACEQVAADIHEQTGRRTLGIGCHVGQWDSLDAVVEECYSAFSGIDILVNNAGMSPVYDSEVDVTEALFDKVIDVNLKGPFRLAALIGTRMAQGSGGSIINISSAGAVHPRPGILPYSAAKAGLNAITVGLAHAYGPSVRVNAIMAGTFLTDVSAAWDKEAFAVRSSKFALQRGGEPSEILGTALYLASDASTYTTGSIITVDGGQP
jgi:NAD(P)-dependent dehydrogenase (short-subunit alcohol dehydrogenase family)